MKEKQPAIFLYCSGIDDVLRGSSKVAGIQVQMSFWAKTFVKHGWEVYTFSNHKSQTLEGIHYFKKTTSWLASHGLSIVEEFFDVVHFLRKTKVDVVFVRGARRDLYFIKKACDLFKTKMVFLGASDRDYELGKELLIGAKVNIKLYRKALNSITYHVTQNQFQANNLLRHYGKQSIVIPNIWTMSNVTGDNEKTYAAVWVANLRRLKRAEWFVRLAIQMPNYRFAIAGGISEQDYYEEIMTNAEKVSNIDLLGPLSFGAVNDLLSKSRLLVCTSEFEGFPNTFLQAWAERVPVVSTVNPNNAISEYSLGRIIDNEDDLLKSVKELLTSEELLGQCQQNIKNYFLAHHDADTAYYKIIEYTKIEK